MTAKRKTQTARKNLERRARAIIADDSRDFDTRHLLTLALTDNYPTLAAWVERAERGECVEESGAGPEYDEAARAVLRLMYDTPGLPDYFSGILHVVLKMIEQATGAKFF